MKLSQFTSGSDVAPWDYISSHCFIHMYTWRKKKRWDILVWSFSVTYLQVYNLPLFPLDNFISLSTFSSLKPLPLNLNIVSKIPIVSYEFNLSNLWPSKNEDGLLPSQFGNVNESENTERSIHSCLHLHTGLVCFLHKWSICPCLYFTWFCHRHNVRPTPRNATVNVQSPPLPLHESTK